MNLVAHFALVRSAHETLLQKCFSRPLRGWGIERRRRLCWRLRSRSVMELSARRVEAPR